MERKNLIGIVAIVVFLVIGVGGLAYDASENGQINQTVDEPVNESTVPQEALNSKKGAGELKAAFEDNYEAENKVIIKRDGNIILMYQSNAQNGNQLKTEIRSIAKMYGQVAAENSEMGSLIIRSNGVLLTVPVDSAIAYGNGDLKEDAFFETTRYDSVGGDQ